MQIEHQKLYQDLEALLLDLSQLKFKREDDLLISLSTKLINYVDELLANHFREEEMNLFPNLTSLDKAEVITKLLQDHEEIKIKNQNLKSNLKIFHKIHESQNQTELESFDWHKNLLYPAYNLIATINHHALREDREFQQLLLLDI